MIMTDCAETQAELDLGWPEGSYERYRNVFGRLVRVIVPVEFWTDDWHDGMRSRGYTGTVCSHHLGGVCLQPPVRAQGLPEERARCFPLTDSMTIELLPGKPADYA